MPFRRARLGWFATASVAMLAGSSGARAQASSNTGDQRWEIPFGDTPSIRSNPALRGLTLPPLGVAGAPGPIVTAGGVIFATGGGSSLYAVDTRDGKTLWSADLGQAGYAVPMTYQTKSGRQFVVIATGSATGAKLQAFALAPH